MPTWITTSSAHITLYELDLWDEWNKFEHKFAEEAIRSWMERCELDYNEMNEIYKNNHLFHKG
jgi:hypothetical protein